MGKGSRQSRNTLPQRAVSGYREEVVVPEVLRDLQSEAPEIIRKLSKTDRTRLASYVSSFTSFYSGPLPPPELLSQFNDCIPDGANRIMVMAEKQQEHRILQEDKTISANLKESSRGQVFGFILVILIFLFASYLVVSGNTKTGAIIMLGDLASVLIAYFKGKASQKTDLAHKAKANP